MLMVCVLKYLLTLGSIRRKRSLACHIWIWLTDGKGMCDDAVSLQSSKSSLLTVLHYSSTFSCAWNWVWDTHCLPLWISKKVVMLHGVEVYVRNTECAVMLSPNPLTCLVWGVLTIFSLGAKRAGKLKPWTYDTFTQDAKYLILIAIIEFSNIGQ